MRKFFIKGLILSSLFSTLAFYSCSSDDSKDDSNTEGNNVKSLRVIAVVLDENGNALNVQDAKPNTTKDYVTAGSGFKHRVLIEDFTGAWCGWCPRVSHSIENLEASNNDDIVAVALHNGDRLRFSPYEGNLSDNLWTKFGIPSNQRGYPFAVLNRSVEWEAKSGNEMNKNQVISLVKNSSPIGIKINSSLKETEGKVTVNFKFNESYSNLKYVVYIVQDGIVLSQSNYTSNYGGKEKISDFIHNSVAKATNNILGTQITNSASGTEFSTGEISFTYKNF